MLRSAALALTLASPLWAEDRALIIGIEGYPNLDLRLSPQSAADDAIAMAQLAVEQWGYGQTEVSLLIDGAASSEAILDALIDELVGLTAPGDRALLYFAGVGSRNSQGQRVILAHDSESLLGRIPEDALSDILDLIADRDVTVIVDAGFRGDIDTPGQRGVGAPGFEASPFAANGDRRAVYAPAAVSQTAWETAAGGVFTTALIDGAHGAADLDGNGMVTHGELSQYLRSRSTAWCDTNPDCAAQGLTPDFAGPVQNSPAVAGHIPLTAAPVTPAAATQSQAPQQVVPNPGGLTLGIDGGTALKIGQSVTFRATTGQSGTLVLLDIDPTGAVSQLFPSRLAPGTMIVPGQDFAIPADPAESAAPLRIRVTGPSGAGMLIGVLVAGDQPDLTAILPMTTGGDTPAYLAQITAMLDAMAARAGVNWSATTLRYTISD